MKNPDALGEEIDRLDSVATMLTMPGLPAQMHVDALKATLPLVVEALRRIYVEENGENPWEDRG